MEAIVFKFPTILNHSKITYLLFFFGIWNCVKERNRILALPKTTNSFNNLGFSAFVLQVLRNNGLFCVYSECTCVGVMYLVLVGTRACHLAKHKTWLRSIKDILVPRGCDPFGQRHGSRPLAGSNPFLSLIGQMRTR